MLVWVTRSKCSSGYGSLAGVTDPESDPGLGIEPDPRVRLVDHRGGDVDTADPGPRVLAGEEEGRGAGSAADVEHPLRILAGVEHPGGERGEVVDRAGVGVGVPVFGLRIEEAHDRPADQRARPTGCGRPAWQIALPIITVLRSGEEGLGDTT